MNKSFSSLYLRDPYFWNKKINQTAQPIIRAGCEERVIKEVETLVVFTKWDVIATHSFWHRLPERLEMVQSYALPYPSPRLVGYYQKHTNKPKTPHTHTQQQVKGGEGSIHTQL